MAVSSDPTTLTLTELAAAYRRGDLTVTEVVERYLEKLEPGPIYRLVTAERALAQARRADERFRQGIDIGPLQGIPLALKDLMDTEGEVTAAGSKVLAEEGLPAQQDCPAAARLDAAGAVFLGKTGMTELAFGGLGTNPHFGTPGNALDARRVPGGSSSGSGVAVATGLACAAIGSDTGGSVRIPAAFNGIVGLKTSDKAIPMDGCVPLSTTLDTLGPMARTVEDAFHLWRALAAKPHASLEPSSLAGLRLLVPTTVAQEGLDDEVKVAFEAACRAVEEAGAQLEPREVPQFGAIFDAYARYGTFAGMEAWALHEGLLERHGERIDPRVSARIVASRERRASDYIRLTYERERLCRAFWEAFGTYDAVLTPTVAILPPTLESLASDDAYFEANALVLRNTMLFNFLGVPAVSLPCGVAGGGLSVGLSIAVRAGQEAKALGIARAFEQALTPR
jgi:aspartyl-tRNA(Asn)/glutamyl-tRNA(Gln) amidotransferase subunit A